MLVKYLCKNQIQAMTLRLDIIVLSYCMRDIFEQWQARENLDPRTERKDNCTL